MPALPPVVMLALLPVALINSPVPMFFILPLFPVPFHFSMGYPFVSRRQTMTIVLWQRTQSTGNSSWLHVTPLPVIVLGSVPMSLIRTPPIVLIKQNIHINVRNHVNICSRYHNHVRRSSKPDGREIVPYTYIYPSLTYIYIYPPSSTFTFTPASLWVADPVKTKSRAEITGKYDFLVFLTISLSFRYVAAVHSVILIFRRNHESARVLARI